MKPALKRTLMIGLLALLLAGLIAGCNRGRRDKAPSRSAQRGPARQRPQIAAERGLTPDDI